MNPSNAPASKTEPSTRMLAAIQPPETATTCAGSQTNTGTGEPGTAEHGGHGQGHRRDGSIAPERNDRSGREPGEQSEHESCAGRQGADDHPPEKERRHRSILHFGHFHLYIATLQYEARRYPSRPGAP